MTFKFQDVFQFQLHAHISLNFPKPKPDFQSCVVLRRSRCHHLAKNSKLTPVLAMRNCLCNSSLWMDSPTNDFLVIYGWTSLGKLYAMTCMVEIWWMLKHYSNALMIHFMVKPCKSQHPQNWFTSIICNYDPLNFWKCSWRVCGNICVIYDNVFEMERIQICVQLRLTFPGFSAI